MVDNFRKLKRRNKNIEDPGQEKKGDPAHGLKAGDDDLSYDRYTDENRHFHFLLAKASGNHELAAGVARLHDRLARFMVLRHAGRTMEATHAAIIEALRVGDKESAHTVLRQEMVETRERILDHVIREKGSAWHLAATEGDHTA